jgi:hypothetical protein
LELESGGLVVEGADFAGLGKFLKDSRELADAV